MSPNGRKTPGSSLVAILLALPAAVCASDTPSVEEGRSFWAFRPIAPPPVTEFEASGLHPVDALSGSEAPLLSPAELVRKLYFDLHGLPPTPEQIEAFVTDPSEEAYLALVGELLESRRFAERWGRHWLALVRYADSSGGGRAILLRHAWRYRDYVVDSFDRDRPYGEFVSQQIAGDLLATDDPLEEREAIVATGFLSLGPTNYELQDKNQLRMDVVDEQIDTMGRAFLGMSLGCARCHDHFFDPVPTADYYALAGIFRSTKTLIHSNVSKWVETELPPKTEAEREAARLRVAWGETQKSLKEQIAALKKRQEARRPSPEGLVVDDDDVVFVGEWTSSTWATGFLGESYWHDGGEGAGKRAVFKKALPAGGRYEVRVAYTASGNRTPIARATIHHAQGQSVVEFDQRRPPDNNGFHSLGIFEFTGGSPAELHLTNGSTDSSVLIADAVSFVPEGGSSAEVQKPETETPLDDGLHLQELEAKLKEHEKNRPAPAPIAMSVVDEAEPTDHAINIGGNTMNLGPEVPRGFLTVASRPGESRPEIAPDQSGRLELARWLASPEHPLVARVYANRVWEWLTGSGIVTTTNDFGATGARPSNPALLDHLAAELHRNGGSTKSLVRHIVSSITYRTRPATPRRLDAESIRDAMLSVSGELELEAGSGPAIKGKTSKEFGYRFDSLKRSLYTPVFRNNLPELFQVFDFPDPNLPSAERNATTLATQALYMMNHPWVIARSEAAASRWMEGAEGPAEIVRRAYLATLSRLPDPEELQLSLAFLGDSPDRSRVAAFQQSLFASIDFRHQ